MSGNIISPDERKRECYGATVTFENGDGELLTIVRRHESSLVAIREACDAASEVDATYRVVLISTPLTIAACLRGKRPPRHKRQGWEGSIPQHPETYLLSRAGRTHMLHPRLRGTTARPHLHPDWRA